MAALLFQVETIGVNIASI